MRLIENESEELRELEEEMIGIKIIAAGTGKKGCSRETNGPARWKNAFAGKKNGPTRWKNAFARRKMDLQVGKMHLQEEKWTCKSEKCICRKKNGDAVGKMHLQRFKKQMQTIKK